MAAKEEEAGEKLCQNSDCHHPHTDNQGLLPIDQFPDDKTCKSGKGSKCKHCVSSNKQAFCQNLKKHEMMAQGLKLCANHPHCIDPDVTQDGYLTLSKFYDQKYRGKVRKMSRCMACIRGKLLKPQTKENREFASLRKKKCTSPKCQNPNRNEFGLLDFDEFSPCNKVKSGVGSRQPVCKHCVNNDIQKKNYARQYAQSSNGKNTSKKYRMSRKGKTTRQRYRKTEICKAHVRRSKANRRSRERKAKGSFSTQEWIELCKAYDYTCLSCREVVGFENLTVDHIKPLVKGGDNTIDNIQPLCLSCNASKGVKTIDYRYKINRLKQLRLF